jgi:hypothetical protein
LSDGQQTIYHPGSCVIEWNNGNILIKKMSLAGLCNAVELIGWIVMDEKEFCGKLFSKFLIYPDGLKLL